MDIGQINNQHKIIAQIDSFQNNFVNNNNNNNNNNNFDPPVLVPEIGINSSQQEIENLKQKKITIAEAPQYIRSQLDIKRTVWIHSGLSGASEYAVKDYIATRRKDLSGHCIELDAGHSQVSLLLSWMEKIKAHCPELAPKLPPNYLDILGRLFEVQPSLCVVKNVKRGHIRFLENLIARLPCKWILLSDVCLSESSVAIRLDQDSFEGMVRQAGVAENRVDDLIYSFQSFSTHPYFIQIAIALFKDYDTEWLDYLKGVSEAKFLDRAIGFLKGKHDFLSIGTLHLAGSSPIKKAFAEDQRSIDIFLRYQLIEVEGDWLVVPRRVQDKINQMLKPEEIDQHIHKTATEIQNYVSQNKAELAGMTPLINSLFDAQQETKTICMPLLCLMAAAGHLYTQLDDPGKIGSRAAREISMKARRAIEEACKIGGQDKPDVVIQKLDTHSPLLAHLYTYLLYQIGRIYFYTKDPDLKLGSKQQLQRAKQLAQKLSHEGKRTLLLKLIDRNGLLFHESEEGNFLIAYSQYLQLLEGEELVVIDYPANQPKVVHSSNDPMYQVTCYDYALKNLLPLTRDAKHDRSIADCIESIIALCDRLQNRDRFRPYLALISAFLARADYPNTKKYLAEVRKLSDLTKLKQLEVIELEIQYAMATRNEKAIVERATHYRSLALQIYPENYYANYQFLHYELFALRGDENKWVYFKLLDILSAKKEPLMEAFFKYIERQDGKPLLEIKTDNFFASWNSSVIDCLDIPKPTRPKGGKKDPKPDSKRPKNHSQPIQRVHLAVSHVFQFGPARLVLGDAFYQFLNTRGELPDLMQVLENGIEAFKASHFAARQGYRLRLEDDVLPSSSAPLNSHEISRIKAFQTKYEGGEWRQFSEDYIRIKAKVLGRSGLNAETLGNEELSSIAQQVSNIWLFQQVGAIRSVSVKHVANQGVRFRKKESFIYHTLKHLDLMGKDYLEKSVFTVDGEVMFNSEQFEKNAEDYLQKARWVIQHHNWYSKMPDQKNDLCIDHAFYVWEQSEQNATVLQKLSERQEAVNEKKHRIKDIEYELRENINELFLNKNQKNERRKIENRLQVLKEELNKCEQELSKSICEDMPKVTMVVVREQTDRQSQPSLFWIKTFFETEFNLEKSRDGLRVSRS